MQRRQNLLARRILLQKRPLPADFQGLRQVAQPFCQASFFAQTRQELPPRYRWLSLRYYKFNSTLRIFYKGWSAILLAKQLLPALHGGLLHRAGLEPIELLIPRSLRRSSAQQAHQAGRRARG